MLWFSVCVCVRIHVDNFVSICCYLRTGHKDGYDFRDNEEVDWSAKGQYSTHLFAARAQQILMSHDFFQPLFLYLSFQAVHGPFEVPDSYIEVSC